MIYAFARLSNTKMSGLEHFLQYASPFNDEYGTEHYNIESSLFDHYNSRISYRISIILSNQRLLLSNRNPIFRQSRINILAGNIQRDINSYNRHAGTFGLVPFDLSQISWLFDNNMIFIDEGPMKMA